MTLFSKTSPTTNPFVIGFFGFALLNIIGTLGYLWPAVQITFDYFSATASITENLGQSGMSQFVVIELERILPIAYAKAAAICLPSLAAAIWCYRKAMGK
jgi:hypothetical protein